MISDSEYAICPYCGALHGDCWEWVKTYETTTECSDCGKEFAVYADYHVTYITNRIKN